MRPNRRWGVVASLAASAFIATAGLLPGPATGATTASPAGVTAPATIKRIDARAFPNISVDVFGGGSDVAAMVGKTPLVAPTSVTNATQAGVPVDVVYIVDTSAPMSLNGRMDAVKQSLGNIASQNTPGVTYGLITASTIAVTRASFADGPTLAAAVADLRPSQQPESAVRSAVRGALSLFRLHPDELHNVVLITASSDNVSGPKYSSLRSDLLDLGVTVSVVAVDNPVLDGATAGAFASDGHGAAFDATDATTLGNDIASASTLATGERRINMHVPAGVQSFDLVFGAQHVTVTPAAGFVTVGSAANPTVVNPSKASGPSLLQTSHGKLIVIGLGAIAFGMSAAGIALLVVRNNNSSLEQVLMPYAEHVWAKPSLDAASENTNLVDTKFVQRAVELTRRVAGRSGWLTSLEHSLEAADLPVHPAEFLLFYSVIVAVVSALVAIVSQNIIVVLLLLGLLCFAPSAVLKYLARRRSRRFQGQLPDTLSLLAGSLKAGYSLMQGVAAVSEQVDGPMGKELRRVVLESRLGRPLEEALNDSAHRTGSADYEWAVMAVNIQREVGGNLAELLMTVADTMVQRERLRRDVRSLTAEGRISAIVIGALPILLGFAMYTLNPGYMRVLFHDRMGQMVLAGSVLLAAVGFWWMKKTIEVEI